MAYRSRDVGRPNWGSVKFMAPALETGFWTFVFRRLEEEETELENQKTKVFDWTWWGRGRSPSSLKSWKKKGTIRAKAGGKRGLLHLAAVSRA